FDYTVIIYLEYPELLGGEQVLAAVQNLLEHGLRVGHRAANDLEHFGGRPLLFECFSRFVDQPRVLALEIVDPARCRQRKGRMRDQRDEDIVLRAVKATKMALNVGVQITDRRAGSQRGDEAAALFAPGDTLRPISESSRAGAPRFLQPRGDRLQQRGRRLATRKARGGNARSTGLIDEDKRPLSAGQFYRAFDRGTLYL